MRFNPRHSLILLAAVVLASSSLLLCTASPVARDLDLALYKRDPARRLARVASTTNPAPHVSSAVAKAKTVASSHLSSDHPSSNAALLPLATPSDSSTASPSITAATNSASATSNNSAISSATVNSQANSSASSGVSTPLIGGVAGVGGIIILAAGFFAVVRYRKQQEFAKTLSNNANPFTVPGSIQSSAAISTSPFPSHLPYERLDDPKPIGTFNVISTYAPTLGDELDIQPGDKVTVLVEYDDGWVQGVNESRGRLKGVFPKHCVDYGQPYEDNQNSMLGDGDKRVKRVSSMYGNGAAFGN